MARLLLLTRVPLVDRLRSTSVLFSHLKKKRRHAVFGSRDSIGLTHRDVDQIREGEAPAEPSNWVHAATQRAQQSFALLNRGNHRRLVTEDFDAVALEGNSPARYGVQVRW